MHFKCYYAIVRMRAAAAAAAVRRRAAAVAARENRHASNSQTGMSSLVRRAADNRFF